MIKIYVNNVKCKIEGLSQVQTDMIDEALSYLDNKTERMQKNNEKFMWMDMRKHMFSKKTGKFYSGLLKKVLGLLKGEQIEIIDQRKEAESYNLFPLENPFDEPRYYQAPVIEYARKEPRVSFEHCTSSGKTQTIMQCIKVKGLNTLIIVPNLNLLKQFYKTAKYYFGSKVVGIHSDSKQKPITIANIQSLVKYDQAWFDYYDCVSIDECHHSSASTYFDLNKKFWNHIKHRIFCSGTMIRSDGSDMKLYGIASEPDFFYTVEEAINDGFVVPPYFYIYTCKHYPVPSAGWTEDYKQNIVLNKNRNGIVFKILDSMRGKTNKKGAILVSRHEHVDILKERYPDAGIISGEEDDNTKTLEDFYAGKYKLLIGIYQSLGEGIDLPNIDYVVIALGMKSEIVFRQAVGRCIRLNEEENKKFCLVFDIYDKGDKILEKHSKERMNIYREHFGEKYIKKMK